jgi:hypothetical protein
MSTPDLGTKLCILGVSSMMGHRPHEACSSVALECCIRGEGLLLVILSRFIMSAMYPSLYTVPLAKEVLSALRQMTNPKRIILHGAQSSAGRLMHVTRDIILKVSAVEPESNATASIHWGRQLSELTRPPGPDTVIRFALNYGLDFGYIQTDEDVIASPCFHIFGLTELPHSFRRIYRRPGKGYSTRRLGSPWRKSPRSRSVSASVFVSLGS